MPKPVLQAMVLADHIYRDADTGKFLIIGTFAHVFLRSEASLPESKSDASEIEGGSKTVAISSVSSAGTPYLYLALTGVRGNTPLRIRYVDLSDSSVSLEGQIEVESVDPLDVAEFSLPLPSLLRPPGSYALDVLYDEEILGSWRVTIAVEPPTAEDHK